MKHLPFNCHTTPKPLPYYIQAIKGCFLTLRKVSVRGLIITFFKLRHYPLFWMQKRRPLQLLFIICLPEKWPVIIITQVTHQHLCAK